MTKPKVFVARKIFQEALDMIAAEADVEVWPDLFLPPATYSFVSLQTWKGFSPSSRTRSTGS